MKGRRKKGRGGKKPVAGNEETGRKGERKTRKERETTK